MIFVVVPANKGEADFDIEATQQLSSNDLINHP
jgi:hypothetical protein